MDPLAKAQELHSRMHADLLQKGKRIAALEAQVAQQTAALAEAERRVVAEGKRGAQALQERDLQLAERIAELEAREEALAQGQEALDAAKAQCDAEQAQARQATEAAAQRVAEIEKRNLELIRERDATLAANAVDLHAHHEQLISISRNYLEQQNADIERLAQLKEEKEKQRVQVGVELQDKLVAAERKYDDLQAKYETELASWQEQLRQTKARAEEDGARHAKQLAELEATLAQERADMSAACARISAGAQKEVAMLTSEIAANAKLISSLTAWDARRAAAEAQWQQQKEEKALLLREVAQWRDRYEALESSSNQATQAVRREVDAVKQRLAESEAALAKKTEALQVYHKEIKANASKLAEVTREKTAAEKAHKEQAEKAAAQLSAAQAQAQGGRGSISGKSNQGIGDALAGLFSRGSSKESEKAAAEKAAAAAAATARARADSAAQESEYPSRAPIRSFSSESDDGQLHDLQEEMSVALSRRVEKLEEERLALASQVESLKKRAHNAELLNQLLSEQRAAAGGNAHPPNAAQQSKEQALRAALKGAGPDQPVFTSGGPTDTPKKSGLLGGLLGGVGKKDASASSSSGLSDPARVRALLEESIVSNQTLTQENETRQVELKRLKHMLETAKQERDEALAREKVLMAAQQAKAKGRKSAAGAQLGLPTPDAGAATSASATSSAAPASTSTETK